MNKETIFYLNKLADEHEELARAYRVVANNLMNGQPKHGQRHYDDPSLPYVGPKRKVGRPRKVHTVPNMKGHKYNGTHWMQKPENRAKMLAHMKRNLRKNKKRRK
jgi:hypothetical protein